jgi:uncharacterized protein YggU (UPF0235/DUF167 family)
VTAAPVDGAANAAVTRVLARALEISPSAITVAHGREGRTKIVEIAGLTASELERRLALVLARAS